MAFPETEPNREDVRESVEAAFDGPTSRDCMRLMSWDGVMGCWTFVHLGIFIGIETDGYIHS